MNWELRYAFLCYPFASIGVTYGYGTEEELKAHGADWIAHSPSDIPRLVIRNS
ncbi:hypothetical protein [Nostoc sp. NMS4]|uniref:hypothetical protein n=1 Tax=Nostoc sp. NMS4 TaxID=2815390 RepID=UPI0025F9DB84|nr:hypothetical protein [Nostoc sp. NMS4]